jgi:hypothetical protein
LISASNENLQLTKELELLLGLEKGKEISSQKNTDELRIDSKTDYRL